MDGIIFDPRVLVSVVRNPKPDGGADIFQIGNTDGGFCLRADSLDRWGHQAGQKTQDGNHHQQFD
jgi:hypothetical protein